MRNILEKVRKRDRAQVKADAQAIYLAGSREEARAAFRAFQGRWRSHYPQMVCLLEKDLPELLAFFDFPEHLWKKLRTTNIIERCLCGGPKEDSTHGLLCERQQCGSNCVFNL